MAKAGLVLGLVGLWIVVSLAIAPASMSQTMATAAMTAAAALFTWTVFRVNSSFWSRTLWCAARPMRAVALTFDDGPDPTFTPRVLEILAEKQAPATFFVVGERAARYPELVRRLHDMGHTIGNHSQTHSLRFHFRHRTGLRREIGECNDVIRVA